MTINYDFNLNEEIARWATEVYIKKNPELGWWVAFTNPTAGPWKKIVAQTESGTLIEIHRFTRDGERPDLILVNDRLKLILIIEAKDYIEKLITEDQMKKSIRVVSEMSNILGQIDNKEWQARKGYRIIPGFLWMCEKSEDITKEDQIVRKSFQKLSSSSVAPLNIVILKDEDGSLANYFLYQEKIFSDLNLALDSKG